MESVKEKIERRHQYELQKRRAREKIWYLYGAMISVLLGRTMILPILKFYADELNKNAGLNGGLGIRNDDFKKPEEEWLLPDMYQGVLPSLFYMCYGISSLFSGWLANVFGRRPIILVSLFGMTIGFIGQALAWNFWTLVVARCFAGFFAPVAGVCQAYINDIVTPAELPEYTAVIGNIWGIAYSGGPMLALIVRSLFDAMDFEPLQSFKFCLGMAAVLNGSMFMFSFFKLEESKNMNESEAEKQPIQRFTLENSDSRNTTITLVLIAVAGFFYEACSTTHGSLYPQMMGETLGIRAGWNHVHFAFLFTLWGIFFSLIQRFYPRIEAHLGVSWTAIVSCVGSTISIFICVLLTYLLQGSKKWVLIVSLFPWSAVNGLFHGINTTSAASFICQTADPSDAARWLGYWGSATCVGCMMSFPWLMIATATKSIWVAYIVCISFCVIAGFILFLTLKTAPNMQDQQSMSMQGSSNETFSTTAYSRISSVVTNSQIVEMISKAPVNAMDFPLLSPLIQVMSADEYHQPSMLFDLDAAGTMHSISVSNDFCDMEKPLSSLTNLQPIVESEQFISSRSPPGLDEISRVPLYQTSRTVSHETENEVNDSTHHSPEADSHVRGRIDPQNRTIIPVESPRALSTPRFSSDSMQSQDLPTIPEEPQNATNDTQIPSSPPKKDSSALSSRTSLPAIPEEEIQTENPSEPSGAETKANAYANENHDLQSDVKEDV